MKKLLLFITALFMVSCTQTIKDPIESTLVEYYKPSRKVAKPSDNLHFALWKLNSDYKFISYEKLDSLIKDGKMIYKIKHCYSIQNRNISNGYPVECNDEIMIDPESRIVYDNQLWLLRGNKTILNGKIINANNK